MGGGGASDQERPGICSKTHQPQMNFLGFQGQTLADTSRFSDEFTKELQAPFDLLYSVNTAHQQVLFMLGNHLRP